MDDAGIDETLPDSRGISIQKADDSVRMIAIGDQSFGELRGQLPGTHDEQTRTRSTTSRPAGRDPFHSMNRMLGLIHVLGLIHEQLSRAHGQADGRT